MPPARPPTTTTITVTPPWPRGRVACAALAAALAALVARAPPWLAAGVVAAAGLAALASAPGTQSLTVEDRVGRVSLATTARLTRRTIRADAVLVEEVADVFVHEARFGWRPLFLFLFFASPPPRDPSRLDNTLLTRRLLVPPSILSHFALPPST